MDEKFRSDPAFVIAAVKSDGEALEYASEALKDDPKIVRLATEQYGMALQHASERLRDDKDIFLAAMKDPMLQRKGVEYNRFLGCASDRLKADREVARAAIQTFGGKALWFPSEELRGDREIVLEAVAKVEGPSNEVGCLFYASDACKNDKEIVLRAVQADGLALEHASPELQGDREVATAAINTSDPHKHGQVLRFASLELRADREFVLHAVSIAGGSLVHCPSKELLADQEIALAALENCGTYRAASIFHDFAPELKADREVVRLAVQKDSSSLFDAPKDLQLDPDVVALACETMGEGHDFDLCLSFRQGRGDLYDLYMEQSISLYQQFKKRKKEHLFTLADPEAALQVAERWLSESLEKSWLTGEVMKSSGIPMTLHSSIVAWTGVREDHEVASKFVKFGSILCHLKKALQHYVRRYNYSSSWNTLFVSDLEQRLGLAPET